MEILYQNSTEKHNTLRMLRSDPEHLTDEIKLVIERSSYTNKSGNQELCKEIEALRRSVDDAESSATDVAHELRTLNSHLDKLHEKDKMDKDLIDKIEEIAEEIDTNKYLLEDSVSDVEDKLCNLNI